MAFSLFTAFTWVGVFLAGSVLTLILPKFVFPEDAIIMGFFAVIPFRALGVFSMSKTSFPRRTLFTLIEPSLTGVILVALLGFSAVRIFTGLILSSIVAMIFAFVLISSVEVKGRKLIGFSPIRMFRAFLSDWLEGESEELESYLTELGVETEVDTAAFAFRNKAEKKLKAVMLVSNFHPGPFLNVGSSVLPFLFQRVIHRTFGAVALVPHGVSGHELNLVSQQQNAKLIEWTLRGLGKAHYLDTATPVTRARNGIATATTQLFDGCALVTMTNSPQDMEDVPPELAVRLAASTHGRFMHLALIDAHNSLTGPTTMTAEKIGALEEAAISSLQTSWLKEKGPFRIGVGHVEPRGLTLKDGMGPAGIAVLAVETQGHVFAYVNIDGNNMAQGLREQILARICELGYDDGEVMTTDTHMVNGVVSARLGYHLIGEVGSRQFLLEDIEAACRQALQNLEPCEVAVFSEQLPVTTLGSKSLRRVMNMVYRSSKLTALTLFPLVILVAGISLVFLV